MRTFSYALLFIFSNGVYAQQVSIKEHLIEEWQLAKTLTNEYLIAMPADKYNFRPHDSIRSFSQQMLHLAQVNNAMVSNGTGAQRVFPRGRNLEQAQSAQSKDSVIYYVNASLDYAITAIRAMDDAQLIQKVKDRNAEETRFGWLLKALIHLAHHRGQTAIYIREAGVKPPAYIE